KAGQLLRALFIEGYGLSIQMDVGPEGEIVLHNRYLNDTIDINPQGGYPIYPDGAYNNYLLKLDSSGTFQWAKTWSVSSYRTPIQLKVDNAGNILIHGIYRYSDDFDPGPCESIFTSEGDNNAYLQKFSSSGDFLWAQSLYSKNDVR